MKGASVIAQILKKEGAECLFCFPVNQLIDAAAELDIRPIMPCTERAVVGMADGYTRVNNGKKIGICAVQQGPGAENAFGGVAQAYSDSTPILIFPGAPPESQLGTPPHFEAFLNYQRITKWSGRINRVDRIPDFLRRAFTYLRVGRPGPVLLDLPADVITADFGNAEMSYTPVKGTKGMADPQTVKAAVKALIGAKKPILHAGIGALYAEAWDELREVAELLQAPVMTTLPGKSVFPEDHPLSLGCGGLAGSRTVAHFLAETDLIFGIGSSLSNWIFAAPIPKGKIAIQLTIDERDLNKDYPAEFLLMGDAKLVLSQMIEEIQSELGRDGRKGDDRSAKEVRSVKDKWLDEWMPKLTSEENPINPYRVIWDLQSILENEEYIVTHDAGSPRDQMAPFWTAKKPNSYIGWGKSTHLGYSLPLALGAKVARPEKIVVNVMGDAAFGMSGTELATASRNKIATLTIVLNNSCLGGYDKHIPVASRRFGTRFLQGEYAKAAEALGTYAERIDSPREIIPGIKRAIKVTKEGRPALLEMITKEEIPLSKYW
jgi:acetolactate synthase-1/2/3 large subunit